MAVKKKTQCLVFYDLIALYTSISIFQVKMNPLFQISYSGQFSPIERSWRRFVGLGVKVISVSIPYINYKIVVYFFNLRIALLMIKFFIQILQLMNIA